MPSGRRYHIFVVLLALPMFTGWARAQEIWTHTANSCAIDNSDLDEFDPNSASLKFIGRSRGSMVARCNVTNLRSDGGDPGWGTLEVLYRDRDGTDSNNQVRVRLIRIGSGGNFTTVAEFDSDNFTDTPDPTLRSVTFVHDFEFHNGAYYVELQVSRDHSRSQDDPAVYFVRLTP